MNVGQFDKGAREASRKVVKEATEAIRAVALESYKQIQQETKGGNGGSPVASGRLAASTRLEINAIDQSYMGRDPDYRYPTPDEHGYNAANLPPRTIANRAISGVAAKLRRFKLGDTIYISNSVPYIRRIEIGGHSWQTPDGVFEVTMRKIIAQFRNIRVRILRSA